MSDTVTEFYAQTYDASVPDWPGEIDFYRVLAVYGDFCGQDLRDASSEMIWVARN
jgi:hypothetical protein